MDTNTIKPAYSSVNTATLPIEVQNTGSASISIVNRTSEDTVVSGGQTFPYSVKLNYSKSVQIDSIYLHIDNTGFDYLPITQNLSADSIATWNITTSDSFNNFVEPVFSVFAFGHDQNLHVDSSEVVSLIFTDTISVIPKASIKLLAGIHSPAYADSTRIVSLGQNVVLKAWVEKENDIVANAAGTGQIYMINPEQFGFSINPDSLIKTYTGYNDTLFWELQAPDTQTVAAAGLELVLDQNNILNDINSGAPAKIAEGFASKTISLSVEKKRLVVKSLNDKYIEERNLKRGGENVPL